MNFYFFQLKNTDHKEKKNPLYSFLLSTGLKLSLDHDMISRGVQDKFGQLTCQAYGNEVNIESFTVIWVKVTGEATDLITVTPSSPSNRVSQDGIYGNGTLKENNGYISLDQMDAAICGSSYFLCEASFTNSAGERERAIAMARPGQPHKGYSDQRSSNATDAKDVAALEKKVEDMTEAFRIFNSSYSTLLQTRQKEQQEQRKTLSRISMLEDKVSKLNGSQSCDPCSNITQAVENLEKRLEQLEDGGDDHGNPGGQVRL